MIKLVHESSERDRWVAKAEGYLKVLAAQLMRLATRGGSAWRFEEALLHLQEALDLPDGRILGLLEEEVRAALDFRPEWTADRTVDHAIDDIAVQALRLVASRLEGNLAQDRVSKGRLVDAVQRLEDAREESRRRWAARDRSTDDVHLELMSLTGPMRRALRTWAESQPGAVGPPGHGSLQALVR